MNILIFGGTRFFGIYTIQELLGNGHNITIVTRGYTKDSFGEQVNRIVCDRRDTERLAEILRERYFDIIIDKIAYSSNDIKRVLDVANYGRYIQTSTMQVYSPLHLNMTEDEYDPAKKDLVWCDNAESYGEAKRLAECAMFQYYGGKNMIAVRYPVVLGRDDYTERLEFYVKNILLQCPMSIDNIDCKMNFIDSKEAGRFIAYLADKNINGVINGAATGLISLREILEYVEAKTGKKAVISPSGESAPYNGLPDYSLCTDRAKAIGYNFSLLHDWIFDLLDYYIIKNK